MTMILLEPSFEEKKEGNLHDPIQVDALDNHVIDINNISFPLKNSTDSSCQHSLSSIPSSFDTFDRNVMSKHVSGLHMLSRLQIESNLCSQTRRLSPLPSSMLGLDIISGRDEEFDISSVSSSLINGGSGLLYSLDPNLIKE